MSFVVVVRSLAGFCRIGDGLLELPLTRVGVERELLQLLALRELLVGIVSRTSEVCGRLLKLLHLQLLVPLAVAVAVVASALVLALPVTVAILRRARRRRLGLVKTWNPVVPVHLFVTQYLFFTNV